MIADNALGIMQLAVSARDGRKRMTEENFNLARGRREGVANGSSRVESKRREMEATNLFKELQLNQGLDRKRPMRRYISRPGLAFVTSLAEV